MPDSNNPQSPNFQPGVGRLVTDRFDFQQHIDGQNFRHVAPQIDLSPSIVINGDTTTNVQDAIVALKNIVEPPTIQFATSSVAGIVQLAPAGDVQGSYNTMRVFGIRGYPINNTPPSTNNVLTWNGSAWGPAPAQGVFVPSGDLTGNSSSQQVVNLSGSGGEVTVSATAIVFNSNVSSPIITQIPSISSNGANLVLEAQGIGSGVGNGGNIYLYGGHPVGGSTLAGGVSLSLGGNPLTSEGGAFVFQALEVLSGKQVIALFPSANAGLTTTDMPINTGNQVVYIGDATTAPTASSPTGSILWSQNGMLNIMQENGIAFTVGSVPNPNIWNSSTPPGGIIAPANGTIAYNVSLQSVSTTPGSIGVTMPANSAARMDISFVGKQTSGSANVSEYNYSMGWVRNGSRAATLVGTLTSSDERDNVSGAWTPPVAPTASGGIITVSTGFNSGVTINWTVIIQLIMATAV